MTNTNDKQSKYNAVEIMQSCMSDYRCMEAEIEVEVKGAWLGGMNQLPQPLDIYKLFYIYNNFLVNQNESKKAKMVKEKGKTWHMMSKARRDEFQNHESEKLMVEYR